MPTTMKSLFARAGVTPPQLTATAPAAPIAPIAPIASSSMGPPLTGFSPQSPEGHVAERLRVNGKLHSGAKRAFDFTAALMLLIVLSPLLAMIAWFVMRDGGPCVFGHTRVGNGGVKFKCLKFRSMVVNADAVLKELLASDPQARAEWERDFKLKKDIRITKIGHFIRHTSLDELPQLWNVVRGEMSLVGPRPVIEKELERYYGDGAAYYLMAKPGITGLWQVSGRNDIDYATRVSLDVSYVTNWSFSNDILILLKTVVVVLRGRGAY
ncbi:Undecaprenyl-phosphate galactose phosphotransferase WbaP [Paraburkholderia sp. GAS448]